MGNKSTRRGFTLIELLVVVLIIGILAAIAVPQYKKAVEKSRAVEALSVLASMRQAMDLYILQHGYPAPSPKVLQLADLNLDMDFAAESKYFSYDIYLGSEDLWVTACRLPDEDYCITYAAQPTEGWYNKECAPETDFGTEICNAIQSQL